MQYLITPLLEVLNPTNTVSRNRLLSFAIDDLVEKLKEKGYGIRMKKYLSIQVKPEMGNQKQLSVQYPLP